jgi:hypothetical protein
VLLLGENGEMYCEKSQWDIQITSTVTTDLIQMDWESFQNVETLYTGRFLFLVDARVKAHVPALLMSSVCVHMCGPGDPQVATSKAHKSLQLDARRKL